MLERNAGKTEHFGFLISAELQEGKATTTDVLRKLSDSLTWVEGIGDVSIECLGKIDVYEPVDEMTHRILPTVEELNTYEKEKDAK